MGAKVTEIEGGGIELVVFGTLANRMRRAARELKTTPEALTLAALNAQTAFTKEIEKGRREVRRANRGDK